MFFIKERHNYATTKQITSFDYDPLVLDSTDDFISTVEIPKDIVNNTDICSWAIIEDNRIRQIEETPGTVLKNAGVWLLQGVSELDNTTELTLGPVWKLFTRDHVWDGSTSYNSKGKFIAAIITNEYVNQSDTFYDYPYISVAADDTIPFEAPADEVGDIYSLEEYIEKAVSSDGLGIRFFTNRVELYIELYDRSSDDQTVVFNDGHTIYEGIDFNDQNVGKVTVIQNGSSTDYYLATAMTISTTVPADRVDGEWRTIKIGDDDDPLEAAKKEFEDTINGYKIEWSSDYVYNVGDNVRFQLPDKSVYYGKVTYKAIKSSDDLIHYRAGSLKTTLTDKLRDINGG